MKLKILELQLSAKPFVDTSDETAYKVCHKVFNQWKPLAETAEEIDILLFLSDGSEIFEYNGNLEDEFEWAYWLGVANHFPQPKSIPSKRAEYHTHFFPKPYIKNPSKRSYAWAKRLVEIIRDVGKQFYGETKKICVGWFYDNGPEFAISDFKYNRHKEIAQAHTGFKNSFVTCTSILHGDTHAYAGFPDGIPEGTSIGKFLARQYKHLAKDLNLDYLWLSNGMGFGTETWGIKGMLFDKEKFYPEKAQEASTLMLNFWNDFYKEYPDCRVTTRGSNFSAGLEISTDACPIEELYYDYKIAPPVNSPWAALNFKTGVEIAAWMSHIAELPAGIMPFRFYTHDPWFMNSPWLDRYAREPWDIYQPMSVSRITDKGEVGIANSLSFLSVDDSWGRLPDQVPEEVIPHIKEAFRTAPDKAGPFVWVYPFNEYSDIVRKEDPHPEFVFTEELFISEGIQNGLPLNTVITARNFRKLIGSGSNILDKSVLVVPVCATTGENEKFILNHIKKGGKVMLYGTIQNMPQSLRDILSLEEASPITGTVDIVRDINEDIYSEGKLGDIAYILPQYTCGGLTEVAKRKDLVKAYAMQNGERRDIALINHLDNGAIVSFVRTILSSADYVNKDGIYFEGAPTTEIFHVAKLMRLIAQDFGWKFIHKTYTPDTELPRINISRNDNAFYFSIFSPNTTCETRANTPFGAPILTDMETRLDEEGNAIWHPGKCWHKECRCFIKQDEPTTIFAKTQFQAFPYYTDNFIRRNYSGLKNAEVRFFVSEDEKSSLEIVNTQDEQEYWILFHKPIEPEWERTPQGLCAVVKNVSGFLYFSMVKNEEKIDEN